jgi:hypothetical protein
VLAGKSILVRDQINEKTERKTKILLKKKILLFPHYFLNLPQQPNKNTS